VDGSKTCTLFFGIRRNAANTGDFASRSGNLLNSGYRVSGMKLTSPLMPRCDLTAGRVFVM